MFETQRGEQVETGLTGDELFSDPLYDDDETSLGLSRPGFELLKLAGLLAAIQKVRNWLWLDCMTHLQKSN
jgi:hypothetical protein